MQDQPLDLFGRGDVIKRYLSTRQLIKAYEQELEDYKQVLQRDLGNQEVGVCGDYSVTWKQQSRATFDAKRFAADHPELNLSGYYKTSTFRKFEVKESKE